MSVPAHKNTYGGSVKTDKNTGWLQKTTRLSDGRVTYSQGSVNLHRNSCWRSGYGVNPIKYIKGILPWRYNRGYYRKVIDTQWHDSGYSYVSGGNHIEVSGIRYAHSDVNTALTGPLSAGESFYFTDARNQARVESLLKLASGKANYGQFLAEAVESSNMLAGRLADLCDLLLAVKRGRFGKVLKRMRPPNTKDLANGLLEVRYGWMPLMSDIHAMVEDLRPRLKPPLMIEGNKTVISHHSDSSNRAGSVDVWRNRSQITTGRNTCHIYARVSDAVLNKAQSIGVLNPLSLGWEVVPYSFVIDWAIPVGNVLSALTATAGLTFVDGYENEIRQGQVDCDIYRNGITYSGKPESMTTDVFVFVRRPLGGFPAPQFYGKSPFSTSHVTSALALLRQLF